MHSILRHRKLVGSVILRKCVLNISRFTTHYLRFPPSLDLAISMFSALAGGMPELANVMSTQVVLECLAHKWQFNPRTSSAIYWSFVHVPAHLLAALITSLVAYAIMLAGRGEFQFRHLGMLRCCFLANALVLPAFCLPPRVGGCGNLMNHILVTTSSHQGLRAPWPRWQAMGW